MSFKLDWLNLSVTGHMRYQAANPATAATHVASTTWQVGCCRSIMAIWQRGLVFPLAAEHTERRGDELKWYGPNWTIPYTESMPFLLDHTINRILGHTSGLCHLYWIIPLTVYWTVLLGYAIYTGPYHFYRQSSTDGPGNVPILAA